MALISANLSGAPRLATDDALLVKKLPNAMTIAVMKNSEPPDRVSMRLLIRRGSAHETQSERGLAHFLEHMAFNGTKNFPSGDMVEYFQRLGMAFGADTNAHTGFTETVYKLDMPEVSPRLLSDGMKLLRDYCDGMLLGEKEIDKERGVIIAEKKSRDTTEYRKAVKEIAHYFKGTIFPDRMPIGDEGVIKNAKRSDFEAFYRAAYRPENAVLVVVGDVKPDEIFALAEKTFASFKGDEKYAPRGDDFGKLETEKSARSLIDAAAPDADCVYDWLENSAKSYATVSVSKQIPAGETLESRIEDTRLTAALYAVNARYAKVADTEGSGITNGSAGMFDFGRFARTVIFNAESPVGKCADALAENFRQVFGIDDISEAELAAAEKKLLQTLESAIAAKGTRKNKSLANEIVSAFSDGETFTSPEDDLEIAKYALANFTAKDASALLRKQFANSKVKVFVSDSARDIPQAELEKLVGESFASAKNSRHNPEIFAPVNLEFAKFGKAGKIADVREEKELGIKMYGFENGVRLNVKQTDFSKDEIRIKISFGNGLLDIPADKPEYYAAIYALTAGGTKFQSAAEISSAMYTMKMSVAPSISGNSFEINAACSRKYFDSAVSLAATTVAAAGFREDGADSLRKFGEAFYRDYATNPSAKMMFAAFKLFDSPIAKIPGNEKNFRKIKMSEIAAWLAPILEKSYMEISIVGDVSQEEAVAKIAETFGALPPREKSKADAFAKLATVKVGKAVKLTYRTKDEPRSVAAKMWLSGGREDPKKMRIANVLSSVFDDVLRKDIRESEGKVYSPFAYNSPSTWVADFGLLTAATFVAPEYNAEILESIEKCAQKTAKKIDEDEFERAKIPLTKEVEANLRKNSYWLNAVLNLCQAKPVNIELAKSIKTGYAQITLEEVRAAAAEIFGATPYSLTITPKADSAD